MCWPALQQLRQRGVTNSCDGAGWGANEEQEPAVQQRSQRASRPGVVMLLLPARMSRIPGGRHGSRQ